MPVKWPPIDKCRDPRKGLKITVDVFRKREWRVSIREKDKIKYRPGPSPKQYPVFWSIEREQPMKQNEIQALEALCKP